MDNELLHQIDNLSELLPMVEEKLDEEVLICECFCVSVGDIKLACSDEQVVNLDKLQRELSLGHGCQDCLRRIDSWKDKIF